MLEADKLKWERVDAEKKDEIEEIFIFIFEDGPMMYPANTFDSGLRGD